MKRAILCAGVSRRLLLSVVALSLLATVVLPWPAQADDPLNGANSVSVHCAFIKNLNDDPIRYPGQAPGTPPTLCIQRVTAV